MQKSTWSGMHTVAGRHLIGQVLLIAALVEEAADLMDPALTRVALHPALLHLWGLYGRLF